MLSLTKILLALLMTLQVYALSEDRLVLIQSVSKSKKTFAIRYGAADGISPGQQSLFTGKALSFQGKCLEVNRHYSVWQVSDKRVVVPFRRGEMVTFTNSLENMWSYLPTIFKDPKELPFSQKENWSIGGSYSYALNETVSEVEAQTMSTRTGFSLIGKYHRHFSPHIEYSYGLRIDRDQALVDNSNINAITTRYFGIAGLQYYFSKKQYSKYRMYTGVDIAFGLSSTTIDESTASGTAMILPQVKLGLLNRLSSKYTFYAEGAIESLTQNEKFIDDDEQETTITATKIVLGIRF